MDFIAETDLANHDRLVPLLRGNLLVCGESGSGKTVLPDFIMRRPALGASEETATSDDVSSAGEAG